MPLSLLRSVIAILLGAWILLSVACVFWITLGIDEAWVLNGLRSILEPHVENLSTEAILTSGGLFSLVNLYLEKYFGSVIWIHRCFSLLCILSLLCLIFRMGMKRDQSWIGGALSIAVLLGIPGMAEVSTLAFGNSIGCLLMVLTGLVWTRTETPGVVRSIITGVLLGSAIACRMEMGLIAVPLILLSVFKRKESGGFNLRLPAGIFVAMVVATVVFGASFYALRSVSSVMQMGQHLVRTAESVGLAANWRTALTDYPRILNKLSIGQSFSPLILLAIASLLPFCVRSEDDAEHRFSVLMVASGWAIALGWLVRSPIPHLRYLWPSLVFFAIPAGLTLARIYQRYSKDLQSPVAMSCLILAIASIVGGSSGTVRSIVLGDSDLMSWEWSREVGLDYFRRFEALRDQRDLVNYLKNEISPDAKIYSTLPYKLRYLAHRPIIDISAGIGKNEVVKSFLEPIAGSAKVESQDVAKFTERESQEKTELDSGKKYVVLMPEVGTYLYMKPDASHWYESHGTLVKQFGRASIYLIEGEWPDDPDLLRFHRTNYLSHPSSAPWFGRH